MNEANMNKEWMNMKDCYVYLFNDLLIVADKRKQNKHEQKQTWINATLKHVNNKTNVKKTIWKLTNKHGKKKNINKT